MLTTRRPPLTNVLAAAALMTLAACARDSSEAPGPCLGCEPSPRNVEDTGVVVENLTAHSVSLTVTELPALWIERKVLEGSFAVPIAPAARGKRRQETLAPGGATPLRLDLGIIGDTDVVPGTGGIAAIGSGPAVLAVGTGRLVVRTRDGADILEAEDPRAVTVLPVERGISECPQGTFGAEVPALPGGLGSGQARPVDSVTRDGDGCRRFGFSENGAPLEYRACVADAAYPFADGDAITFAYFPDDSVLLARPDGTALELVPLRFPARRSATYRSMTIGYSAEESCTAIDPPCGDVLLPAKILVSFDGKTSEPHVVGDSFPDARDPRRTIFVLGAVSRPVVVPFCEGRVARPFAPTEVFLAVVERPLPGPRG